MKSGLQKGFNFPYKAKFKAIGWLNKEVMILEIERPYGFRNTVGQALAISIDKPGYELDVAPFTIANIGNEPYVKLIVKLRRNQGSLTKGLSELRPGDVLQLSEPWDTYSYKGPGTFIAAGTGAIPFVTLLRYLRKQTHGSASIRGNQFIYTCKSADGMLFKNWLSEMLGTNFLPVLSESTNPRAKRRRIDQQFLARHLQCLDRPFYVCGPIAFEQDIKQALLKLGVTSALIQTGYNI